MVLGFKNQGKIGISLGKALKRAQGSLEKKKELISRKKKLLERVHVFGKSLVH